jgi:hypothetical protein
MAIGAYTYAVLTIPVEKKPNVYYLYGITDSLANVELPLWLGLIAGGLLAALLADLIGAPVLRLKSDYFAIATLGFSEIVRILVGSSPFNRITNGSLGLNSIPGNPSYYTPFIVAAICLRLLSAPHHSYWRAFKANRRTRLRRRQWGSAIDPQADGIYHQLILYGYFRRFAGNVPWSDYIDHLPDHADLQYPPDYRNRRHGKRYRKHYCRISGHRGKGMVAAFPRSNYDDRRFSGTASPYRIRMVVFDHPYAWVLSEKRDQARRIFLDCLSTSSRETETDSGKSFDKRSALNGYAKPANFAWKISQAFGGVLL